MSSPSSATNLPIRVVVFASEQLFPALQFLLHVAHQFGRQLQSVHIYCTADERRSAAPARRLRDVMRRWAIRKGRTLTVDISVGEMWPDAVRNGLLDWFEAHPDSHWLINVTGGTKPMSAAAIELTLSTNLQSRRVIYQEIDGQWAELVHDTHGFLTVQQLHPTRDAIVPLTDTLDRLLSLEDLVATQFSEVHKITTQLLQSIPMDEATRQVLAMRWNWREMLRGLGVSSIGSGDAFERYIGAGLIACGVHIKHSLKVLDSGAVGKVVREVDLVGCHRGRLVCIDIKLPGAKDHLKGTQLADVVEMAHSLGGRGALAIALRPGWPEDSGTRRLADALGVKLLTQVQAPRLFSTLLGWIDPKLTPSAAVLNAEGELQAHQAKGNDVLSNGDVINVAATDDGALHLPNELERMCEQRGESWALVQMLDQSQYLLAINKRSAHAPAAKAWPRVIDALHAELSKVALPGANGDDRLTETKGWVFGQFKAKHGVRLENLQTSIRGVLKSFK